MKRIALLLVLAAACRTVAVPDRTLTGGPSPRGAVDRFLAGARAQDMQALGAVFGNEKGPVREHGDRATVERQLLIQLQCLRHDKATISEPTRGEGGSQIFMIDFVQSGLAATSRFTVVKGPSDRWYVEVFDIVALQNRGFCSKSGG